MKTYKVVVTWEVYGEIEVKAKNLQEACDKANFDTNIPLPEANYVNGSFKVDRKMSKYLNEGLIDKPKHMV